MDYGGYENTKKTLPADLHIPKMVPTPSSGQTPRSHLLSSDLCKVLLIRTKWI